MNSRDLPPEGEPSSLPAILQSVRAATPARILVGRVGLAYRTRTYLELRHDHAAAVDAVRSELEIIRDLGPDFVERWRLFDVQTCATSKAEFLLRPDLGRKLHERARAEVSARCPKEADFQVVIGDGLSAAAAVAQLPRLLPSLAEGVRGKNWLFGQPFVIHHCRVGVLNDIGELLDPAVVVLLIGERPGLATAESLSAYMAYRPRHGHTDGNRNLISNIHERGVPIESAAERILALAEKLRRMEASGVEIKEELLRAGRAMPTPPASQPRPAAPPS
jgi:ethanolamine ammonia-lyase small subunit